MTSDLNFKHTIVFSSLEILIKHVSQKKSKKNFIQGVPRVLAVFDDVIEKKGQTVEIFLKASLTSGDPTGHRSS